MPEFTQHPETLLQGFVLLFALLIGHALADYPLQGDFLAEHKDRHWNGEGAKHFPGNLWLHCLLAHSLIHAGFVWLISGHVVFGLVELVLHFFLDFAKCEKWTNYTTDQILHAVCKASYVGVVLLGWVK